MTAIHAVHAGTTWLDRMLLGLAETLERATMARVARRRRAASAPIAQQVTTDARADAQALGSLGILPR